MYWTTITLRHTRINHMQYLQTSKYRPTEKSRQNQWENTYNYDAMVKSGAHTSSHALHGVVRRSVMVDNQTQRYFSHQTSTGCHALATPSQHKLCHWFLKESYPQKLPHSLKFLNPSAPPAYDGTHAIRCEHVDHMPLHWYPPCLSCLVWLQPCKDK